MKLLHSSPIFLRKKYINTIEKAVIYYMTSKSYDYLDFQTQNIEENVVVAKQHGRHLSARKIGVLCLDYIEFVTPADTIGEL